VNGESNSIEIVNRPLNAVDVAKLSITLNIRRAGFECLTDEKCGTKFRSKDVTAPGETEEQVEKQIEAVYRGINRPRPDEMASLATRFTASYKSDNGLLGRYGDIVLLMDWREIAADLVIFNGDVKNVGAKLVRDEGCKDSGPGGDWLRYFTLPRIDLESEISSAAEQLSDLLAKSRIPSAVPPRLIGKYFEARLFRALRPTDIAKVFVPDVASSEFGLVTKLKDLKMAIREGVRKR
jgi:hypothetical protein